MISVSTHWERLRWWLLALLVGLAPFHAFLITWFRFGIFGEGSVTTVLSMWREILVLALFAVIAVEVFMKKIPLRLDLLDWLILGFTALAFALLPFQLLRSGPMSQWLLGFRFDVMPLLVLLMVRRVEWNNVSGLLRVFFVSAGVVLLFGVLQAAVLPQNFLTYFGYGEYQHEFAAGTALPACSYLEHTQSVCRAVSTFGGPTRYGTYVLLVVGVLIGGMRMKDKGWWILLFLALANILLTFSRSIWIGAMAMAAFGVLWLTPRNVAKKIIIGGVVLMLVASLFVGLRGSKDPETGGWQPPSFLETVFLRVNSTGEHARLFKEGLALAAAHPLGMGLGTVGPASVRYQKLLTENWYLQILIEMGVLGLALFLGVFGVLTKKLLEDRTNHLRVGLFLALLGIAVTGLFTHSFEETSAAFILYALLAQSFKFPHHRDQDLP